MCGGRDTIDNHVRITPPPLPAVRGPFQRSLHRCGPPRPTGEQVGTPGPMETGQVALVGPSFKPRA